MRTRLMGILAIGALIFAVACGTDSGTSSDVDDQDTTGDIAGGETSDDVIDEDVYDAETEVSSNTAQAGVPIEVTCTLTLNGEPVESVMDVVVTGTENYTYEGGELTFGEAGEFDVACVAVKLDIEDDTPETVVVDPSPIASVETSVDPSSAKAGETVSVTCTALNALGEEVESAAVEVASDPTGPEITGAGSGEFDFVSTSTGEFDVACASSDGTVTDDSPESITITPGPAHEISTELTEDTIDAGGSTEVTCIAEDQYGNEIAAEDFIITVPEQLTVNGNTVTGTVAGTWEVVCEQEESEADTNGADLTVLALEAEGLALKLIPSKPAYQVGDQVTVGFDMVDMYGNPIPEGEIEQVEVDPVEGITQITENEYQFEQEGLFVFSSCIVGMPDHCDEVEGWCDGTAPVVTIEYPERGATIDGEATVHVTGTVNEEVSELLTFTINGVEVPVAEDNSFDFAIDAVQGMNMIEIYAADTFGNELETMRSFYFSYEFYPMDDGNPAASAIYRSLRLYLDDKLFYNEDPSDEANITALLKNVLQDLDIGGIIPNPAASLDQLGCNYDVYIGDVTFDEPELLVRSSYAGIKLDVTIPNIVALFEIEKTDGGFWCPGTTTGWIEASSIGVSTTVFLSVNENHQLNISTGDTVVSTEDLQLNVDSWFLDLLTGLFSGTIENLVKDEFENAINDLIGGLSESVAELLAEPLEIPIEPLIPGMNPVTLHITFQPEASYWDSEGGTLEVNLAVTAPKVVDRTILGSIARADCLAETPEEFEFDLTDPMKLLLAAHTDVLSEALYAFWTNGGTHLSLTSETFEEMGTDLSGYGVADLNVDTMPLLPPLFTDCNEEVLLTVQWGDLYLETSFTMLGQPVDLHAYFYLEVQAELLLVDDPEEGQLLGIQIYEPSLVLMDIVHLNEEWAGQEETFKGLITDTLIPILMEEVEEPITFAIPAINLQDLLSSDEPDPDGFNLELPNKELVIDLGTLEQILGYIYGEAGIIIQDPAPEEEPEV